MLFSQRSDLFYTSDAAAQKQHDPHFRLEYTKKKELLKIAKDLFVRLFRALKL